MTLPSNKTKKAHQNIIFWWAFLLANINNYSRLLIKPRILWHSCKLRPKQLLQRPVKTSDWQ